MRKLIDKIKLLSKYKLLNKFADIVLVYCKLTDKYEDDNDASVSKSLLTSRLLSIMLT